MRAEPVFVCVFACSMSDVSKIALERTRFERDADFVRSVDSTNPARTKIYSQNECVFVEW